MLGFCCFHSSASDASPLPEARLSEVVGDVLASRHGSPFVAARPNAPLPDSHVRTKGRSRAELTFADGAVVRMGDNTQFGFDSSVRTLNLISGAVLVQVPSGVGGTELCVHNITATTTGTTLLAECFPQAYTKFICLDGTCRLCLKGNGHVRDCVLLRPGEMLIAAPAAKMLPESVDVDLRRLVQTCELITKFPRLPDQESLLRAAVNQAKLKTRGNLVDSGLVIFGRGNVVSRSTPNNRAQATAKPISGKQERTVPE